ncbi:MAG: prepilin-type N-terminal cleavage/methylation domain-containing protein [bacterium]
MTSWRQAQGFTVVELVVVIILVSILSATALSRFSKPDIFAPSVLAGTLAAQVHFAAQAAQSRRAPVTLTLLPDTEFLTLQVATPTAILRSTEVSLANVSLSLANNANVYPLPAHSVWQMTFEGKGDLVAASIDALVLTPEAGITVRLAGDTELLLCVQPIGYVSEQACQ